MPRRAKGLSAAKVEKAAPGRYGDGAGLYLLVRSKAAKFWLFRYVRGGKMREMGLGPAAGRAAVSLTEARIKAAGLYRQVRDGFDPLEARAAAERRAKTEAAQAAAAAITVCAVSERYIAAHEAGWRNPKHRQQWRNTLRDYVLPAIGALPVVAVGTGEVMHILEPLWQTKPETASRVRGRIESILDYAKARGWRDGENPARWRGHLDHLLPARAKVRRVEHHAALPYADLPDFVAELRAQDGTAALALEFTILAAARTGEVVGARWFELDMANKVWTIPAERMKAGKEHRVPLTGRMLAVLDELAKLRPTDDQAGAQAHVFPGQKRGKPLSNMAMAKVLERMHRREITVHGFRSSFRDWAAECTDCPNHVVEAALAHTIGDKVEAAYRRGDLFQKRRQLMQAWSKHCMAANGHGR